MEFLKKLLGKKEGDTNAAATKKRRTKKCRIADRFDIRRAAIHGTMSSFFMARDRESGKTVGLKIGDAEKVDMFEARFKGLKKPKEGEIASAMNHPLIVETYEWGLTTDNLNYIVMEFVNGQGMQQYVHNRDPVLEGRRVHLIRQMAEAVSHVHKEGYIHRDVCPRNFIANEEVSGLKLIDFGLTLPHTKEFMQPGNRTGTPLYMAPEIVRRKWTDQRVDVFAMGVTAYHTITYELPWPVTEMSGLAALAHDTHPPKDILEYRPKLDKRVAKAVMKCLDPDPKNRMESMDAFLREIRDVKQDDE